jgi:uncharacterized protein YktA (UPF0223 family)
MSDYTQRIKAELKWKIDHYFKDLDFTGGDLNLLYKYISINAATYFSINIRDIDRISERLNTVTKKYEANRNIQEILKTYRNFEECIINKIFSTEEYTKIQGDFSRVSIVTDYLLGFSGESGNIELIMSYFISITQFEIGINHILSMYLAFTDYSTVVEKSFKDRNFVRIYNNIKNNPKCILLQGDKDLLRISLMNHGQVVFNKFIYKKIILPIYEHIVNNLDERHFLEKLLERYKYRTEHFNKELIRSKIIGTSKPEEKIMQPDLAMFLYDQGLGENKLETVYREAISVEGSRMDFIGKNYIIETKQINIEKGLQFDGASQLDYYLKKEDIKFGYLVIYIYGKNTEGSERNTFDIKYPEYKDQLTQQIKCQGYFEVEKKQVRIYIIDLRKRIPPKNGKEQTENEMPIPSNDNKVYLTLATSDLSIKIIS